ncbi:MAG TPA: hypothetical protein VFV95_06475 [Vicinamibacterales bacterium]|nr:hypothetical protein [Vicinamibacterales bacterium]
MYRFDTVALRVEPADLADAAGLHGLCASLGSVPEAGAAADAVRSATLHLHPCGNDAPSGASIRYDTREFRILDDDHGSYVTDGLSTLHIRAGHSQADAYLDDSFHRRPRLVQSQFWSFCILALLRPLGYFSLHAAAVVAPDAAGTLIVGPSGSGKSTLAVGLIRAGWGYSSDDAVLLCQRSQTVHALTLRTQFYVDGAAASSYEDMRLGRETVDAAGGVRRQLHIDERYADRRVAESRPRLVLFPTIVDAERSTIVRLDVASTVQRLLNASGPQLFDRACMTRHLAVLGCLARQADAYRLDAGRDLHRQPAAVLDLIQRAEQS